ncbi:RNA-binding S4 domain-containing protein [Clostridium boliviensis]|uniref:RNA-binding S4 domain-containing protein n=1 Tax=Clostridium boliviensis TaxID=318465 RepID=UPI003F6AF760
MDKKEERPTDIPLCPESMDKKEEIMETIKLRDEYIKLGQALKAAGLVGSGVDAKFVIEDGLVSVNGETEYQRGKKLRSGDIVTFDGNSIKIE